MASTRRAGSLPQRLADKFASLRLNKPSFRAFPYTKNKACLFSEATAERDSSFSGLSVGETAARRSRECGGGSDPPLISQLKKTIPEGPELKETDKPCS